MVVRIPLLTNDQLATTKHDQSRRIRGPRQAERRIARLEPVLEMRTIVRVVPVAQGRTEDRGKDRDGILETRAICTCNKRFSDSADLDRSQGDLPSTGSGW